MYTFTLCVSAGIFPFHGRFSYQINILQWKLTVCKMLILIGPYNVCFCVCVWGRMVPCISVHCSLTGLNRVTAVLSIRSPFCVEMIQCASLESYWSQWTEGRRSKTESSCNMLRHLLDVRNKGFDVTDGCQCSSLGPERSCDLVCGGCVKNRLLSWMCHHDLSSCLCHNTSCCLKPKLTLSFFFKRHFMLSYNMINDKRNILLLV